MIFFIHIPKTAGTTFYEIVKRNHFRFLKPKMNEVPKDYLIEKIKKENYAIRLPGGYRTAPEVLNIIKNLPNSFHQKINFIGGHVGYGFHKYIEKPIHYFSFLREPRSRIFSDYLENCKKGRYFYDELSKNDFDFNYYLKLVKREKLDNLLTRQIAGPPDFFLKFRKAVDKDLYDTAIQNSESILFFMIDDFDEALLYFKDEFDWKKNKYEMKNKAKHYPEILNIDETLLKEIIFYDEKLINNIEPKSYCRKSFLKKNLLQKLIDKLFL